MVKHADIAVQMLVENARSAPSSLLLQADRAGEAWNLGELVRRAKRIARGFIARGAAPGARVAMVSRPRPEWVVVDVACQLAGLVLVPLYKNELPAHLNAALKLTECRFAVAEDPWQARKLMDAATDLGWSLELVMFDERIALQHGGELDFAELGAKRPMMLAELDALGAQVLRPDPLDERSDGLEPDACTAIAMTADAAGVPRGVMVTHANLTAAALGYKRGLEVLCERHGVRERRHLLGLPLAAPLGRTALWASLLAGIPVAFPRSSASFGEAAAAFRPTFITAVPGVLERARGAIERDLREGRGLGGLIRRWAHGVTNEEGVLDRWRSNLSGRHLRTAVRTRFGGACAFAVATGAPLGTGTAEFFARGGLPVREAWGMVETVGMTHLDRGERAGEAGIGAPLGDIEQRIAPDGELLVRGAMVSPGYWRDEGASHGVFSSDGWCSTGDLVEPTPHGGLRVTGRKRDIIVLVDGRTIAPRPIEQGLVGDELIAEALVYGDQRPFPVALVVLEPETLERQARDLQIPGDLESWARHPAIYARIDAAVARVNAQLPPHAHLRKFAILSRSPVGEGGELTATNNLRRGLAGRKYQALLETFYAEPF